MTHPNWAMDLDEEMHQYADHLQNYTIHSDKNFISNTILFLITRLSIGLKVPRTSEGNGKIKKRSQWGTTGIIYKLK